MPPAAPAFVGIDVAKAELVIAIRPSGDRWTVANDEAGIQTLLKGLHRHAPALVVLEATGGYERAAIAALAAARLPLVVANPAKSATSPGPPANSPKPIGSMPIPWRSLRSACVPNPGRCPMRRPMLLTRC